MWPFVAIYVLKVHGDIPPSLMVLLFEHDFGQTLFLYGILVHVMVMKCLSNELYSLI